jgi:PKD domain
VLGRRDPARWRTAGLLGLVAGFVVLSAFVPPPAGPTPRAGGPALVPDSLVGTFTLAADGSSPGAVGIAWAGTPGPLFEHFEVFVSSVSSVGPWTYVGSSYNSTARRYFADGLTPDTAYWWMVSVDNGLLGTNDTNVVYGPTSAVPIASVEQTRPGAVELTWNDSAYYTNVIGFLSYEVLEVGRIGPAIRLATITDPATRSYTLTSVGNNTTVSLEVVATDHCLAASDCGPRTPTNSAASNTASLRTVVTMGLSVEARPVPAEVQSLVRFTANESGGIAPFTFDWTFGDGANATGLSVDHRYAASGLYNATCSVVDGYGSALSVTVSVRVGNGSTSNDSSGNGTTSPGPPPATYPRSGGGGTGSSTNEVDLAPIVDPALVIIFIAIVVYVGATRPWESKPPPSPPTGASSPGSTASPRDE